MTLVKSFLVGVCMVVMMNPAMAVLDAESGPLDVLDAVISNQIADVEQYFERKSRGQAGNQSDYAEYYAYQIFNNPHPGLLAPLSSWVASYPDSVSALTARGLHYYATGLQLRGVRNTGEMTAVNEKLVAANLKRAADDLNQAVKLNSGATVARSVLIGVLAALGSRRDLDAIARDGLRAVPDSFALRVGYMNALVPKAGGTFEQLMEVVEESAKKTRANIDLERLLGFSYVTLADGYSSNGEDAKAADFASKAITQGLDDLSLTNAARMLFQVGRYDEADEALDQALALYAARPATLYWKARMAEHSGDGDSAADWYEKALHVNPVDTESLRAQARLYSTRGEFGLAEKNYVLALEHFGATDPKVIDDYLYLLVSEKKQFQRARQLAEAHLDLFYESRDLFWFSYGVALAGLKDCKAVGAMKRYQENCEGGKSLCNANALELSEQQIRVVVDPGRCEDMPALSRQ